MISETDARFLPPEFRTSTDSVLAVLAVAAFNWPLLEVVLSLGRRYR